jgi:hypothetical protein
MAIKVAAFNVPINKTGCSVVGPYHMINSLVTLNFHSHYPREVKSDHETDYVSCGSFPQSDNAFTANHSFIDQKAHRLLMRPLSVFLTILFEKQGSSPCSFQGPEG